MPMASKSLLDRFHLPVFVKRYGCFSRKLYSTSSSTQSNCSLSSRMRFFIDRVESDKIDRISKERAVQQIRAWKERKQDIVEVTKREIKFPVLDLETNKSKDDLFLNDVDCAHPWPEWTELMNRLKELNYFVDRRNNTFSQILDDGFDFTRDWATVRSACMNFGRNRFDILRSLAMEDLRLLVGYGCPRVEAKVVFSAKLLRKYARLNEGDVCSSCSLRSSCRRAYLHTPKEHVARTLDVMRILLTFGFESVIGSVENKSLLEISSLKSLVRKLLHEVVKLSAIPIDPDLPPPPVWKPLPKVKVAPMLVAKKQVGRHNIEMKKGDWLCPECTFMNFSRNTVCLQCNCQRPKRSLLPHVWECPKCNFLNFRRNIICLQCDENCPSEALINDELKPKSRSLWSRMERKMNHDFDENESDGAEVAFFEFGELDGTDRHLLEEQHSSEYLSRFEEVKINKMHNNVEPLVVKEYNRIKSLEFTNRSGFDDFLDEEDDDVIENLELCNPKDNDVPMFSSKERNAHGSKDPKECFSKFDVDLEEKILVKPKQRSRHSDSRQKIRNLCSKSLRRETR